jgi:nucleoside-diphosphate-sugar epimerase
MGGDGVTRTLVTGGTGYVGIRVVEEMRAARRDVRVLDVLLHGQEELAAEQREQGVDVVVGDVRDSAARRHALEGVDEVVHLAAIVGDPACGLDPDHSTDVNVNGTEALLEDALAAGVKKFVFASTCSNYGRMADPTVPVTEEGELAPISLYAEQKVSMEKLVLSRAFAALNPTCLRFATVYGAAPRMRFDLTVNEFTRDLWHDRELEVFGEQFWRPYIHVHDAARAVRTVLEAPWQKTQGEVFNAGRSDENYTKQMLVEAIRKQVDRGTVTYVKRREDPRDYKVSFEKINRVLRFETKVTVPQGIAEIASAFDEDRWPDPWGPRYRNIP